MQLFLHNNASGCMDCCTDEYISRRPGNSGVAVFSIEVLAMPLPTVPAVDAVLSRLVDGTAVFSVYCAAMLTGDSDEIETPILESSSTKISLVPNYLRSPSARIARHVPRPSFFVHYLLVGSQPRVKRIVSLFLLPTKNFVCTRSHSGVHL